MQARGDSKNKSPEAEPGTPPLPGNNEKPMRARLRVGEKK